VSRFHSAHAASGPATSGPSRITFAPSGLDTRKEAVHPSRNSQTPARSTFSSRGTTKYPISAVATAGQ